MRHWRASPVPPHVEHRPPHEPIWESTQEERKGLTTSESTLHPLVRALPYCIYQLGGGRRAEGCFGFSAHESKIEESRYFPVSHHGRTHLQRSPCLYYIFCVDRMYSCSLHAAYLFSSLSYDMFSSELVEDADVFKG